MGMEIKDEMGNTSVDGSRTSLKFTFLSNFSNHREELLFRIVKNNLYHGLIMHFAMRFSFSFHANLIVR